MADSYTQTCTARKPFVCQGYRCLNVIHAGEDYARHVAFPGSDVNSAPVPWVLRICSACHTEHGAAMPPRKARVYKAREVRRA